MGAAKVLSMLFTTADYMQPYLSGNVCFGLDDKQVWHLKRAIFFLHLIAVILMLIKCFRLDCRYETFC